MQQQQSIRRLFSFFASLPPNAVRWRHTAALRTAGLVASLTLLPALPTSAQARLENFDALECTSSSPIPPGTGGLNWGSLYCMNTTNQTGSISGFKGGTTSPPIVGYNFQSEATVLTRSGGGLFSLTSGQFSGVWRDGLTVTIVGSRAGSPAGTVTAVVNAGQPQLVDLSSLANVDSVTISGAGGTAHPGYWGTLPMFTLDDLSYTLGGLFPITVTPAANGTVTCTPNPVPEGDNATCTATPAAGFRLASFTGCAQVGTGNTCTLTNVTAPATVSATFAAAPVAVTTLHEWALMLLGLGAAGLGVRRLHRLT